MNGNSNSDGSDVSSDVSDDKIIHHVRILGKPLGVASLTEQHRELDMKVKIVVLKDHI